MQQTGPNPDPQLPPELERLVFEIAALLSSELTAKVQIISRPSAERSTNFCSVVGR